MPVKNHLENVTAGIELFHQKDYKMKTTGFLILFAIMQVALSCNDSKTKVKPSEESVSADIQELTTDGFYKSIADYEVNKEWKYKGTLPAIIDFYATWCPPCRQLSPLVDEVAKEYKGKIIVYRINIDKEKALVNKLGITNIPTLLYIPSTGQPKVTLGYIPKEKLLKTINEVLLTK